MNKMVSENKLFSIYSAIGIIIVIIVGYFFLYAILPFMLVGPPTSLYSIHNFDTENHTIAISIFDSNNKNILFESYNIQPNEYIEYNRGFGWYPIVTLTPFTWSEGNYTFYAILDGNITASHTTNVQITQTVAIDIDLNNIPLEISEILV